MKSYGIIDSVLNDYQIIKLRNIILSQTGNNILFKEFGIKLGVRNVLQAQNVWNKFGVVKRLLHSPKISNIVYQHFDKNSDIRLWHDQVLIKSPFNGDAYQWHRDTDVWGRKCLNNTAFTLWIPLQHSSINNGTLTYSNSKYKYAIGEKNVEAVVGRRGIISYHTGECWHKSGKNSSPKKRVALVFHFIDINRITKKEMPIVYRMLPRIKKT
ncbi:MAG TPA: hypothetical protein ENJ28_03845 [Gammaproteobacteria bacterium]|nr:hypothetical protein [Gammaproteobacteria bacterium]